MRPMKTVVSQSRRQCERCFSVIQEGETYARVKAKVGVGKDAWYGTIKVCLKCKDREEFK